MKKIILIVLLLNNLLFSNDLYLKDFVSMVSTSLNITIVIDNDVDNKISIFVSDNLVPSSYLKILSEVLTENELILKSFNGFYLITKLKKEVLEPQEPFEPEIKQVRLVQLKNIDFDFLKDIFSIYKDIEFNYIKYSKMILINSTFQQFQIINSIIVNNDFSPEQLKLKITILDTNLNKIKEYGTEITENLNLNPSSNFFFNLLAYPFSVNSQVNTNQKSNFTSFIKFLNQNKITELVASPTLTLLDSKEVVFNVVKNIPYLSGSTTVEDINSKTTNSYIYKDIGLKISITPKIFKNQVYLDLDLTSESIIDNSQTPTTSKSFINQSFTMNKNNLFVLTGINQTQKFNDLEDTPLLSDIPFLGWFFKSEKDNYTTSNLTILFELVNEDDYNSNDFSIIVPSKLDTKSIEEKNNKLEHEKKVNQILGFDKK